MVRPGGRVLVTGGNGFLGEAVVALVRSEGRPVRMAVRDASSAQVAIDTVAVGDLSLIPDWSEALRDVDCIVHTAGRAHQPVSVDPDVHETFRRVNVDATLALARQAGQAGIRRLIFISSAHVNGVVTHGRGFRADDPPAPAGAYALAKLDAEVGLAEIAAQTGLEIVTIRPPLITGRRVKGNLGRLYTALQRGWPLPFGLITRNRRDLISSNNLCELIMRCIDHSAAPGRTFMASNGAPVSTRELIEQMADEIGVRANLIPVPRALLRSVLNAAGRGRMASQLTENLEIDISRTREILGWNPVTPVRRSRP